MPSMVRVTNLENGRSIAVRVNDRGPFEAGRVIDLSRRGAQLLGFIDKGTARVRVETVWHPPVLTVFVPDGWTIEATATSRTALRCTCRWKG